MEIKLFPTYNFVCLFLFHGNHLVISCLNDTAAFSVI